MIRSPRRPATPPDDLLDLLGMRTITARAVVAVYLIALAVVAFGSLERVRSIWPICVGYAVFVVATLVLTMLPGDPLPRAATVVLVGAGPLACAILLTALPAPFAVTLQGWEYGATTVILAFIAVRGRRLAAWAGELGLFVVYGAWGHLTGQGVLAGLQIVAITLAALATATIFSFLVRPTVSAVFALRRSITERVAERAAVDAATAERDAQLRHLDDLARPLLEVIGSGRALTSDERSRCGVLEAHFRDRLRAPILSELGLDDALFRARTAGADIVVLDDGGLDEAGTDARRRVRATILDAVRTAGDGERVRIRILPPGRHQMVSVYAETATPHVRGSRTADDPG